MSAELAASKLHPRDVFRTATVGLRTRKARAALSALGILIGVASIVAVLGLSESSKSDLLEQLDRLGTNMLQVQASTGIGLGSGELPAEAPAMIERIGPVQEVSAVVDIDANVYRSDLVPSGQTGGIAVLAAELDLLETLPGTVAPGSFLSEATASYPAVVLGSVAAERLGLENLDGNPVVWLGDQWFAVVGILAPIDLSPVLDRAAIVGVRTAMDFLETEQVPTIIYVRTDPDFIDEAKGVMAATVNPENPDQVQVERPTDAIEARAAAESTFTGLFLGLGAVALLVGGVGIANVMVISVLERRPEIGLRRALGATKQHVASQFFSEALLLALAGGLGGVLTGIAVTAAYSQLRGWETLIPVIAVVGGLAAAVLIGVLAGFYPALRAARLSPTEALRTA